MLDAIGVPNGTRARVQIIATRTPDAIEWQRFQRPTTLLSRVLRSAASVLRGALLAVFGQTYQTGADPCLMPDPND